MRLDDAVTWFLSAWPYEGPRVPTADTVRTYRQQLNWLTNFAAVRGTPYAHDLDDSLLREAFKASLADRGKSPCFKGGEASARSLAAAARALARWLLAQGVPVAELAVNAPKPPERIQPRLRPDEFGRLEAAVLHQLVEPTRHNPRLAVARDLGLLYLLADTGLRAGEVCGMTVADVDFEIGRVTVRRGKGGKPRRMSIVDPTHPRGGETLRLLAEWIRVRDAVPAAHEHAFLWINLYGRPLNRGTLRGLLADLSTAAGLDGNRPCHAFRRGHFTEQYLAEPKAVDVLAARMGWSPKSHQMVTTYTRGAEIAFAEEVEFPSLASQWHQRGRVPVGVIAANGTAAATQKVATGFPRWRRH